MFSGVSSFNHFVHELSVDSDTSSIEYSSGEEDDDGSVSPSSPSSQSSSISRSSNFWYDRSWTGWIIFIFLWISFPAKFLLGIPFRLFQLSSNRGPRATITTESGHPSKLHSFKKIQSLKDHIVHRTTDRRRGVIEVSFWCFF